ncbi:MAG: hypothetical protein ACLGIF_01040 [Actinomycetes bacterium]
MDAATPVRLARTYAAEGVSSNQLRSLVAGGELSRVRRGAYTAALSEGFEARQRQLIEATMPRLGADTYLSHGSAAMLHGLPTWQEYLNRVHVTKPRANGGRVGRFVHVHAALLAEAEQLDLCGLPATALPRTAADCARCWSYEHAVALMDRALRLGLERDELVDQLDAGRGRRGASQARRVAAFADSRAESAGESLSRVELVRLGLTPSDLQLEVRDELDRLVAYADFGWREQRTLGEFDGKIKYGRLLKPGQTAGDVIFAEKRREDRLRDLGWEVVRWTWEDLRHPQRIAERLHRAFERAARRR